MLVYQRCCSASGACISHHASWRSAFSLRVRRWVQLFAATPEAQDPRRQKLIAPALGDLTRSPSESGVLVGVDDSVRCRRDRQPDMRLMVSSANTCTESGSESRLDADSGPGL